MKNQNVGKPHKKIECRKSQKKVNKKMKNFKKGKKS